MGHTLLYAAQLEAKLTTKTKGGSSSQTRAL